MSERQKDILERALWTAAQAGIGVATVLVADLPPAVAVIVAAVVSVVKNFIKTRLGEAPDAPAGP
jgi:hypothetical protein